MSAQPQGRLSGKVVIVTGAAQGIGAVYARELAAQGASVSLSDLADPKAIADEIRASGGRVVSTVADITDAASVARMVGMSEEQLGPIDGLVNNAALFGGLPRKPFTEISSEEWDRVMRVNTRGVLECTKAVVPGMRSRGRGRIVNIASTTVLSGSPLMLHYVASKGAVIAMTRALARELGDHGIAVNCLAPGLTMTDAVRNDSLPATIAGVVQRRCFKREQQPEDLVGPLIFLLTPDSGFITGQTFVVDGGTIMQ